MRILLLLALSLPAFANYGFIRTVDQNHLKVSNTDQTNYPMMFTGAYSYLKTVANGGNVTSSSGFDIIFTTSNTCDLAGLVPFERVVYAPTTGVVEFHILLSSMSHTTDTRVYLCYGLSGDTDHSNSAAVWVGYAGVWHFGDGTTLGLSDSTGNANNCTNVNTVTATTGLVSPGAANFVAASSQELTCGSGSSLNLNSTPVTFEAVVNTLTADSTARAIFRKAGGSPVNGYYFYQHEADGFACSSRIVNAFENAGTYTSECSGISVLLPNTTRQLVGTYLKGTTNTSSVYFDGALSAFDPNTNVGASAIGASPGQLFEIGPLWNGVIDEVRASSVARSADWIATQYNNFNSPSTFYTIGPAFTPGGGGTQAVRRLTGWIER